MSNLFRPLVAFLLHLGYFAPLLMGVVGPRPKFCTSEWRRSQQRQPEGTEPGDVVAATKVPAGAGRPRPGVPSPAAPKPAMNASSPNLVRNHSSVINPFINPEKRNWAPAATGSVLMLNPEESNRWPRRCWKR